MNFCARSVVTCDSSLRCNEIMIPASVVHRLTRPVVVQNFNFDALTRAMQRGNVLFIQRAGKGTRLRSIAHIAILDLAIDTQRDCLVRHGNKHRMNGRIQQLHSDIPLPVQPTENIGVVLCYGDRLILHSLPSQTGSIDPMEYVSWPELQLGDTVLVVPQEGDWVLVNRQPTLVQESMLGAVGFYRCCAQRMDSAQLSCASGSDRICPSVPRVHRWRLSDHGKTEEAHHCLVVTTWRLRWR